MRRFFRSKPGKVVGFFTTATLVGGVAGMSSFGWGGGKICELSSHEFNALQDQAALQEALNKLAVYDKNKNDQIVTLFAMMGCPFCARVRSYLDYYGIEYEEIVCDPMSGKQLVENAVKTVPQIQFRKRDPATGKGIRNERPREAPKALLPENQPKKPEGGAAGGEAKAAKLQLTTKDIPLLQDGPMLADSEVIVQKMSLPLKFNDQLETGDTVAQREELSLHFQRYVYLSTHATWARATAAMESETTGIYRTFPVNWLMGGIMNLVATKKTLKKALANTKLTILPNASNVEVCDRLLKECLTDYIDEKKEQAEEKKLGSITELPLTLIDLEMSGVLSQVKGCAHIKAIIEQCGAQEWLARVDGAIASQEGKKRLLAGKPTF